jgi:FHA domain
MVSKVPVDRCHNRTVAGILSPKIATLNPNERHWCSSEKGAYMFGRTELCDFVLEHPTISRFHAGMSYYS